MGADQHLIVLVTSQDEKIYQALESDLPPGEFRLVRLTDHRKFLKRFYEVLPDVVVIEDKISLLNSVDLCELIRQLIYVPLILIGRDPDQAHVVSGLERGADIYVGLGLSGGELTARTKALLRRRSRYWGIIRDLLNTNGQTIRTGRGAGIRFSPTEFRLLSFLLLSRYKTITPAQMLGHVWAAKSVHIDTVIFYLRRLGRKLEQNTDWRIIGRRGSGYRVVIGPQYGAGLMPCSSNKGTIPPR